MPTRAVDLTDVLDPQARAIEEQVSFWKRGDTNPARPKQIPIWEGAVLGKLTRDQLYAPDGE